MSMIKAWLPLALLACLLIGCSSDAEPSRWVERAAEAHQQADEALTRDDHAAASAALTPIAEGVAPEGVSAADGRVIQQDACFRLALIQLKAREAEAAVKWAQVGLDLGAGQDLYTANLLIARGRAHEALGDDPQAARDYHAALLINEALMNEALDGEGASK